MHRHRIRQGIQLLLLVFVLVAGSGVETATAAARQPVPVRLAADLTCLSGGGVEVVFTVRNVGARPLTIQGDFHLTLSVVRGRGLAFGGVAFVFPAPGFQVIPPGESRTFRVPIGDPVGGEPGADLSGRGLVLEAEVWFVGRDGVVRRYFWFPACNG